MNRHLEKWMGLLPKVEAAPVLLALAIWTICAWLAAA